MSADTAAFDKAAEDIKKVESLSDDDKLKLYGLFKQAKFGDNDTDQPWAVQVTARAKWDAWTAVKGKSAEEAMAEYVELVEQLIKQHS